MSLAITGASGHLGRLVTDRLLEQGVAPADLVLVTRRPATLAAHAERGADVRAGAFDEPASLSGAFAGVQTLLLISTDAVGKRIAQHTAAIEAAQAAGVGHVVYTSMINPSDSNPIGVRPEHLATEEALRASGMRWTFLRNAVYAEVLAPAAAGALQTGTLLSNEGDGRVAYVSREDCADAAAAVLVAPAAHAGKAYDITGAAALSVQDVAALIGELGGRSVEPALVDDAAWVAAMVEHVGLPTEAAELYASFGRGARLGYSAPVSTTVEELTGHAPRPVREALAAALAAVEQPA